MISPANGLKAALIAALRVDPDIAAFVANRVHDRVPAGSDKPVFPFVAAGPVRQDRAELQHWAPCWQLKCRLYVASTAFERDQAWEIAETLSRTIECTRPDLPGTSYALLEDLRVTMIGDAIDVQAPRAVFLDVSALAQPA